MARNLLFGVSGACAFFGFVLAIPTTPSCKAPLPLPEICKHATSANLLVGLSLLAIAAALLVAALALRSRSLDRDS